MLLVPDKRLVLKQISRKWIDSTILRRELSECAERYTVMGAPYREVISKVVTAPKLKVEDKDSVKNSWTIKTVKLKIVMLKASLNKFSWRKLVIEVECQMLKLK